MALISDSKPRERSGGYDRLFGIPELGLLISRIQSAVISSGSELERLILDRVQHIDDLDRFLEQDIMQEGVFIAPKNQIKKSKTLDCISAEPDFLVFKRRQNRQLCHVIELKDGHVFDTKKASAERQAMHTFIEKNGHRLPYIISSHFCCFNQESKEAILTGFKRKISPEEAMTGKEFCELLEIDYEEIVFLRQKDQPDNVKFFLSELVQIREVKNMLIKLLN